jgi:hypothetical protein
LPHPAWPSPLGSALEVLPGRVRSSLGVPMIPATMNQAARVAAGRYEARQSQAGRVDARGIGTGTWATAPAMAVGRVLGTWVRAPAMAAVGRVLGTWVRAPAMAAVGRVLGTWVRAPAMAAVTDETKLVGEQRRMARIAVAWLKVS